MNRVPSRDYGERLGGRQRLVYSTAWHNYCYRRVQRMYLLCVKVLLRYLQCLSGYFEGVMVVLLWIDGNEVGVQAKQHMRER